MNKYIPEKLNKLKPYNPTENIYDIKLDANESFENLPSKIIKQINKRISKIEFNRYPDPFATTLCQKYAEHYNLWSYNVVAGNGSDELISIIISSFLNKGDNLLTFTNEFSMYGFYADNFQIENIVVPKNSDLHIDFEEAKRVIEKENIKMVIFSNPCNPTGQGEPLEKVLDFVNNVDCLVVVDEAYMDFWDQSIIPFIPKLSNLIVLKTMSKDFGVAAARLGFAMAQKEIIEAIIKAKSPFNVNTLSQTVGEVLLDNIDVIESIRKKIISYKNDLEKKLVKLQESENIKRNFNVIKTLTNFILIESEYASDIYGELLKKSICVRLLGKHLRITSGSKAENEAFYKAFESIVK